MVASESLPSQASSLRRWCHFSPAVKLLCAGSDVLITYQSVTLRGFGRLKPIYLSYLVHGVHVGCGFHCICFMCTDVWFKEQGYRIPNREVVRTPEWLITLRLFTVLSYCFGVNLSSTISNPSLGHTHHSDSHMEIR
jgi:hypothetical protein